jgi:glycosyltransferase involved in cell wall biosynthesis
MNIWIKQADKVLIVAPISDGSKTAIEINYEHDNIKFKSIETFNLLSLKEIAGSLYKMPTISWQIFKAMQQADHIHLRCPGNIGLLGCFIQVLFPNTPKTAKYAGNWDPNSKQPWTYRLQKWLLSNAFLTRNMQVLVYGDWKCNTSNIKPFFTATYKEEDKKPLVSIDLKEKIRFLFVGTLVRGKNPLYAIQLVEALFYKGYAVDLCLYGEGLKRSVLESYIDERKLNEIVFLMGNQKQETVKKAFQESHFVILPSISEGWGKAITEGMFWGSVPLVSQVSCIPYLLDYGNRGVLLTMDLEKDVAQMEVLLKNETDYQNRRINAAEWSRTYTLDFFEEEIDKLIETK